jgi:hypothetical protein
MQVDVDLDSCTDVGDADSQLNMLLTQEAVTMGTKSRTLKFLGNIQGHEVVILIDSDSSNFFINAKLAPMLWGVSQLSSSVKVQVANGQVLQCTTELKGASWSIKDVQIVSDLKVLPPPYYDMIVGMDWLESHSPMRVYWLNKWITINQEGVSVLLHGLHPAIPELSIVEVLLLSDTSEEVSAICLIQAQLPASIQQLLDSFSHIFAKPDELPPTRVCDHSIPLVEGAQLVSVMPYRFSPAMKNEIEQQVQNMLLKGIIKHSNSAFSSPVLLVKKKDQT